MAWYIKYVVGVKIAPIMAPPIDLRGTKCLITEATMTAPIHRTIMYSDSVHIPINAITIPTIGYAGVVGVDSMVRGKKYKVKDKKEL